MEIASKNLIKNLKRLRSRLSQEKMAVKVGLSHRQYVRYENGESWPPRETLETMAEKLGTTADALISDPDKIAATQAITPEMITKAIANVVNENNKSKISPKQQELLAITAGLTDDELGSIIKRIQGFILAASNERETRSSKKPR